MAMQTAPVDVEEYAVRRRPEIGQRIRAVRRQQKWTQGHTAEYLGCSRRRVNRVEAGITEFTVFELELLAKAFGVSLSYFLEPHYC
jgi:transcriptional regulator with XRE-family HTH domain